MDKSDRRRGRTIRPITATKTTAAADRVKVDATSKLIVKYEVTEASVHDSQVLDELLENTDEGQALYADSAYTGEVQEQAIKSKKMANLVCRKGYKNNPLSELETLFNRENRIAGPFQGQIPR